MISIREMKPGCQHVHYKFMDFLCSFQLNAKVVVRATVAWDGRTCSCVNCCLHLYSKMSNNVPGIPMLQMAYSTRGEKHRTRRARKKIFLKDNNTENTGGERNRTQPRPEGKFSIFGEKGC